MSRKLLPILALFSLLPLTRGQAAKPPKLDTLYYEESGARAMHKAFASYYRIVVRTDDTTSRKIFRDFYPSGELRQKGYYIKMGDDDAQTVFDGPSIIYYKNGKEQVKQNFDHGVREGEFVLMQSNGLVVEKANFKEGELNGVRSNFAPDGLSVKQSIWRDGKLVDNFYVISTNEGYSCRYDATTNEPLWENATQEDAKIFYRDGIPYSCFRKNAIELQSTVLSVNDYGAYYRLEIGLVNHSLNKLEFSPDEITATIHKRNGDTQELYVLTSDEYMSKVQSAQALAQVLTVLAATAAVIASASATRTATVSSSGSIYGGGFGYSTSGGYSAYRLGGAYNSVTTVTVPDYALRYQTAVLASNAITELNRSQIAELNFKDAGYLRRSTLYPGEGIAGYIMIKRRRGESLDINIPIDGANYTLSLEL